MHPRGGCGHLFHVVTSISSDSTTITMKGGSETVTWRFEFEGDNMKQTWSSTNPSHATYAVYDRPKTCPDEETPAWFDDFMMNAAMGG